MDEGNRKGGPPHGDRRGSGDQRPGGGYRGSRERSRAPTGAAAGPYRGPGAGRGESGGGPGAGFGGESRPRSDAKPAGVGSYRGGEPAAGSGERKPASGRTPWAGPAPRGESRGGERGPPRRSVDPARGERRPRSGGPQRSPEAEPRSYRHPDAESARYPRRPDAIEAGAGLGPDAEGERHAWREAQRRHELRIHGRAACLAVAADRFGAIRKLWHTRKRAEELGPLLSKLAAAKVGYREVDDEELTRIAGSEHHEGICLDIVRLPESTLDDLRERLSEESGPVLLLALAGVGNPHNLGAILRSAAHFGALAVLLPADGSASLSGAVYRTAEGAAERVEIVRYSDPRQLRLRGFSVLATAADGQRALYAQPLPARAVLLLGAEGSGLDAASRAVADAVLAIPGSGLVESLNVAQAATVLAGEWWRVQRAGGSAGTADDG